MTKKAENNIIMVDGNEYNVIINDATELLTRMMSNFQFHDSDIGHVARYVLTENSVSLGISFLAKVENDLALKVVEAFPNDFILLDK